MKILILLLSFLKPDYARNSCDYAREICQKTELQCKDPFSYFVGKILQSTADSLCYIPVLTEYDELIGVKRFIPDETCYIKASILYCDAGLIYCKGK